MSDEWTITEGLEMNAEMIKEFYTHMVFDAGDAVKGASAPVNEVLRKPATGVRTGQNIVWSAAISPGDFTSDTVIKGVCMVGKDELDNDIFIAYHKIPATTVNSSQGMMYEFPYSIEGYLAEYDTV